VRPLPIPRMKARLGRPRWHTLLGSPADFGKLIAEETEKWGQGDPGGQHQAGLTEALGRHSITSVERRVIPILSKSDSLGIPKSAAK